MLNSLSSRASHYNIECVASPKLVIPASWPSHPQKEVLSLLPLAIDCQRKTPIQTSNTVNKLLLIHSNLNRCLSGVGACLCRRYVLLQKIDCHHSGYIYTRSPSVRQENRSEWTLVTSRSNKPGPSIFVIVRKGVCDSGIETTSSVQLIGLGSTNRKKSDDRNQQNWNK